MARDKWAEKHKKDLAHLDRRVKRIYEAAVKEAARLVVLIHDLPPNRLFSFKDYPITHERIKSLLDGLKSDLMTVIVNGIDSAWTLSNNKNNELCNQIFGDKVGKLSDEQYKKYYSTNDTALTAFKERVTLGMNLSDRVWLYTNGFKREIELGLDVGIRQGRSADELSRDLRGYLRHPDKLFRRVRDEHGNLNLSKAAAAYHPGRGVYRSSYMNARRLAATETNIAYATADFTRWQDLDFVVGIRVSLSNNHTCLGRDGKPHPFYDICDELAGVYPKGFKFIPWHPHCRCHATPILKSVDELKEDNDRILSGTEPLKHSRNTITEAAPPQLKKWAEENEERMKKGNTVPYFIRDNLKYFPSAYQKAVKRNA